jgi:hypothetical protein
MLGTHPFLIFPLHNMEMWVIMVNFGCQPRKLVRHICGHVCEGVSREVWFVFQQGEREDLPGMWVALLTDWGPK